MSATPANRRSTRERGRPSRLTPETKRLFFLAIRATARIESACRYAGISYQALRYWVIRGEQERKIVKPDLYGDEESDAIAQASGGKALVPTRSEYVEFLDEFEAAVAEPEVRLGALAIQGASENPAVALRMLERIQGFTQKGGAKYAHLYAGEEVETGIERPVQLRVSIGGEAVAKSMASSRGAPEGEVPAEGEPIEAEVVAEPEPADGFDRETRTRFEQEFGAKG